MLPPLPAALVPALPFLSLIAVDWLRHSKLPTSVNISIALGVPALIALLWAVIARAFTADIGADLVIVLSLSYAVMALPDLAGLRAWLGDTLQSPLAGLIVDGAATLGSATPITPLPEPTALDLRSTTLRRSAQITSGGRVSQAAPLIAPGSLHGVTLPCALPPTMTPAPTKPDDDQPGDPVPVEA